jgi:hypothetical protein
MSEKLRKELTSIFSGSMRLVGSPAMTFWAHHGGWRQVWLTIQVQFQKTTSCRGLSCLGKRCSPFSDLEKSHVRWGTYVIIIRILGIWVKDDLERPTRSTEIGRLEAGCNRDDS